MPNPVGLVDDALNLAVSEDKDVVWALMEVFKALSDTVITTDAIESEAGPEAAPAEIATMAAGGFLVIVVGGLIMAFVALFVILSGVRKTIGSIPVVGGALGSVVGYSISWNRTIIRHGVEMIVRESENAWEGMRQLYHLWLKFEDVPTRTEVRTQANRSFEHFTRWNSALQHDINGINRTLYHAESGVRAEIKSVQHDLHYINGEMQKLWGEVHSLRSVHGSPETEAVRKLQREVQALQHEVQHLEKIVRTPLPHSPVTLPRIEHDEHRISEIETVQQRQERQIEQLQREPHGKGGLSYHNQEVLKHAEHVDTWLGPLIALGPITGGLVKAWRLMRNDECPCPQIPQLGGGAIDGIVADLVLKDGI